ncbi:GxxExxY protein [Roseibacillus ishigakijimensis]|uniref:GxxExxY protein n=1 Tax=Roseibacillus ishigakijimensis TaxID=454146 RepID=A0A934VLX2_9BACT|nr:GxxExxY protein [Roseibacillus ishigakijimensis]MBK1833345.1 GxxExxY protein [Roseibacillus ishigakijimensis]
MNRPAEQQYDLAGKVIGLAMSVHSELGSGFLESVYENSLCIELEMAGISFERQKHLDVFYKRQLAGQFTADIVVEETLIVELKSVQNLVAAHEVQLVNYLTATKLDEGLLLNFGAQSLQFKKKFRQYRPSSTEQNSVSFR